MAVFAAAADVSNAFAVRVVCRHVGVEVGVGLVSGWVGNGAVGKDLQRVSGCHISTYISTYLKNFEVRKIFV